MPLDVVGSRWQRLDDRNDKLSLVLWVSGRNCRLDESAAVVLDGQPREFQDDILGNVNRISFGAGTVGPARDYSLRGRDGRRPIR